MSLVVEGHRKSYKNVHALKSLSFRLEPGHSMALLGPNGAGKSTAIKVLVSLVKPDAGSYSWQGEDLFARPSRIRELIGYVSQEIALDKILTGAEFMRFCAGLLHLDWKQHRERAYALLEQMGLEDAQDRQVGEYSGGMKRRLDLAVALLNNPEILILDEPTTGLDIKAREQIWALIKDYMSQGGALILASHDFQEVGELAENILIMNQGEVVLHGTPEQLRESLGALIVRVKTKEYMYEADIEAVKKVFAQWGEQAQWHSEEEYATLAWKTDAPMSDVHAKVCAALEAAGLPAYSVNVQKPTLEDAYRFCLNGGAA